MKLLALIKKEFLRFFRDPRLIVTMLIPGILIYVIYSLLGNVIWNEEQKYDFKVLLSGQSQLTAVMEGAAASEESPFTLKFEQAESEETAKTAVEQEKVTAYLVFSENFDEEVAAYVPDASGQSKAPQVEIYYRAADEESTAFYSFAIGVLDAYESAIANKFDVNAGGKEYNVSSENDVMMTVMGGMLPFLIVIFIFSACMSVTLEAVAGEKERGTLATILVTPVKRTYIALGKVLPLSCISLIGAVSSFLGVALSMPKLMGTSIGNVVGGFGFASYLLIFLLIVSLVPLIVSAISVVSTYSRSVKEASGYTSVIMILTMVLSLVSAFVTGIGDWIVVIPILNAVVCMQGILGMNVPVWQSLVSVAVNLVYMGLLVLLIAKMLSSERIMFGK